MTENDQELPARPGRSSREADIDDQIAEVIEDVIGRRSRGEALPDEQIVQQHPHLLPDLKHRLRDLHWVRGAERVVGRAERAGTVDQADGANPKDASWSHLPAGAIPGLEIREGIHRGGQGVVYRAVQLSTGREVAVKVTRDGPLLGPRDKARFEREVRLLAQLKHPNIVTIYDSGVAAGTDYFVMDYIVGQPLDVHLERARISLREKVALFAKISEAVAAAHLRGVIHRDLKPANIMIDRQGEPHILDFGLARFASEEIEGESYWQAMTETGHFVGSVPWASPEQVGGARERIDLRTDVYSLGVVFYQTLTGRFPYVVQGAMRDVFDNILDAAPEKPRALNRRIDGELETIVLKCLAKEPERRYQSAIELARDIRHYQAREPIDARRDSTLYLLRKQVGRHRVAFALSSALLVVLVCTAVGMTLMYAQASFQQKEAEREAETVRAISEFLVEDMLAATDPLVSERPDLSVREALDNAASRIEVVFQTQPDIEAGLRSAIGRAYLSISLSEQAERHLRRAELLYETQLGEERPETLRVRTLLVEALTHQGKLENAVALGERTLRSCRQELGPDHQETLRASFRLAVALNRNGRFADAEALHADTLRRRQRVLGNVHRDTVESVVEWGRARAPGRNFERNAEVEEQLESTLSACESQYGHDHPFSIRLQEALGRILHIKRRVAKAEELLTGALAASKTVFGEDHETTIRIAITLSMIWANDGRLDSTESVMRELLPKASTAFEEGNVVVMELRDRLAHSVMGQGRYSEALQLYSQSLAIEQRVHGEGHIATTSEWAGVSYCHVLLGHWARAESGLRLFLETFGDHYPPHNAMVLWSMRQLNRSLAAQGSAEEARAIGLELLENRRAMAAHADTDAYQLNAYAWILLTVMPPDLRDVQEALRVARKAYGLCTDDYHYNRYTLALALEVNGDVESAVEMLRRALSNTPIEVSVDRMNYEAALVRCLESLAKADEAEEVYRDTLMRRRAYFEAGHADIAESLVRLGQTLLRHGKPEQAVPPLREAAEILAEAQNAVDGLAAEAEETLAAAEISGDALTIER